MFCGHTGFNSTKNNPSDSVRKGYSRILLTGAPQRDLPAEYKHLKNVHRRFCRWRDNGNWENILTALIEYATLSGYHHYFISRIQCKAAASLLWLHTLVCNIDENTIDASVIYIFLKKT